MDETGKLKQRSARDEHNRKKLRHGKKDNRETAAEMAKNRKAVLKGRKQSHKELFVKNQAREQVIRNEDNNAGTEALKDGLAGEDTVTARTRDALYSRKMKKRRMKTELTPDSEGLTGVKGVGGKTESLKDGSNEASRQFQKKNIRHSYHSKGKDAENVRRESGRIAEAAGRIIEAVRDFIAKVGEIIAKNPKVVIFIAIIAAVIVVISVAFTSCSVLASSLGNSISATSFTSYDEDILAVDRLYSDKERDLKRQIDNIPTTDPGYDEYEYFLDEIGHNPYELAAYLTVKYEDYKKATVREELDNLFSLQYKLTKTPRTETRTRTVTRTGHREVRNPDGSISVETYTYEVEESYTVRILTVKLENKSLGRVIAGLGMTADEQNRYDLLLSTKGNKPYLFEDIYSDYENPDEYHVPGSALSDTRFAMMISVGECFLGRPYVWGGSSPSTGFDCSGFVSYVLNQCGWNVGRRSAAGLRAYCTIIPESEAKPGDLIFFKGTYNTPGASHVGIYVGNGMMLHCGNPIQYTSVETRYWRNHFFGYGRLP